MTPLYKYQGIKRKPNSTSIHLYVGQELITLELREEKVQLYFEEDNEELEHKCGSILTFNNITQIIIEETPPVQLKFETPVNIRFYYNNGVWWVFVKNTYNGDVKIKVL